MRRDVCPGAALPAVGAGVSAALDHPGLGRIDGFTINPEHVGLLAGVVALAAGVKSAIAHLGEPPTAAAAWYLAGGVLVYLMGGGRFRLVLGIRPVVARVLTALLAAATVPDGWQIST